MDNSAAHRLSAAYDLPFPEMLKTAIRSMTYGELLDAAEAIQQASSDPCLAARMWAYANKAEEITNRNNPALLEITARPNLEE
jgi:hypothetical protein